MRKLIGTIVILLVLVAVFGWYRGWFSFNVEKENGKTDVNISIDKGKIKKDVKELKQKVKGAVEE